jgi:hypothetical protein
MLGDSYIDANQPWLGTQADPSQPWWQGVVNFVSKAASAVKAVQPAIKNIASQVDALKQQTSTITAASYGQYNYGAPSASSPTPVAAKDNSGAIVLGVGVAIAASALIYLAASSGKEKKKK